MIALDKCWSSLWGVHVSKRLRSREPPLWSPQTGPLRLDDLARTESTRVHRSTSARSTSRAGPSLFSRSICDACCSSASVSRAKQRRIGDVIGDVSQPTTGGAGLPRLGWAKTTTPPMIRDSLRGPQSTLDQRNGCLRHRGRKIRGQWFDPLGVFNPVDFT